MNLHFLKTTALVSQTAAAANSGTLGFTAGITLDIKGNERKTSSATTTSRASNLNR